MAGLLRKFFVQLIVCCNSALAWNRKGRDGITNYGENFKQTERNEGWE